MLLFLMPRMLCVARVLPNANRNQLGFGNIRADVIG